MGRLVRYSVNLSDKWKDVAPFFDTYPAAMEMLRAKIANKKNLDFFQMSVRGMLEAVGGGIPTEWAEKYKDCTIKEWAEILNGLADCLEKFEEFLIKTTPPTSIQQARYTKGVIKMGIEEAVLMTLKKSFSLQNLEDATRLTVYEYMMARKEVYNEAIVAFNISNSNNY